jgi:hypothetical protein
MDEIEGFKREQNQIKNRIWSIAQIKHGMKVLDVGVGEEFHSSKELIDLGAEVVGIDINLNTLKRCGALKIDLVQCDISKLPFKPLSFDLAIAYFTLHEINPGLHHIVISELAYASKKIMIVEPDSESGDEMYRMYKDIWMRAMHSIGKFEDLQNISYWENLLEKCRIKVSICERIVHKKRLPPSIINEEYIRDIIQCAQSYGLPDKSINEFRKLGMKMKLMGMMYSNINVIVGNSPNSC